MSKDKISDYSSTPANNTDIGGINIAEGMLPSDVNNAIREQMAQLKNFQSGASSESVTFVTVRIVTSINDTNGNEIFGITATGSAVNELTIANAATGNNPVISATGGDTNIGVTLTPKGTGGVVFPAGAVGTPAITTTGDTNTGIFFPAADTIAFAEGGAEAMRIDSSGNVGINKSSPDTKLNIGFTGADAVNTFRIEGSNGSSERYALDIVADGGNGVAKFMIGQGGGAPVERARIDPSGHLLVGTTAAAPGYGNTNTGQQLGGSSTSTFSRSATDFVIVCNQNTVDGSTFYQMQFRVLNVSKGSITSTSSATAYNTSSDYRLKENIALMQNALGVVAQLKPVTYNWKVDGSAGQGFIAHELQEVVPDCVTGEKDAVNADGTIKPQQIDTSFLVATLTAAIQELKAITDAQASRIETLEAKVAALEANDV